MSEIYLSVIIPTKNEEKRLGRNLDNYIGYLKKQKYSSEVIIADCGSTDKTEEVAMERKNNFPNLRFEVIKKALGKKGGTKGIQVKEAMNLAYGAVKMFIDADGATRITELNHALPFINQGYDIVIGSRFLEESLIHAEVKRAWYRELLAKMANLVIRILAVKGIKDTQCGFKIFSKRAADDIFTLLKTGGWGFDMEVLTIAQIHGYKIKEVPVEWREVGGGNINFKAYLQSLKDLLRINWYKITGQYSKRKLLRMRNTQI